MRWARSAWLQLGVVVAFGIATLGAVVLLARAAPAPPRVPFDERPLKRLKSHRPSVVFIGNSMVYTRFDGKLLNQLVSPERVEILAIGGTRSSVWYAELKYYVVASGVRPRVVLFFREKELTQARAMVRGGNAPPLQRVTRGRDPVIEKKLGLSDKKGLDGWRAALGKLAPVERLRAEQWESIDELALGVSSALAPGPRGERRKTAINGLFGVEALRAGPAESREPSEGRQDFSRLVARSFLPEIFALAKDNGIPLTFARVKTRHLAEGGSETAERTKYMAELRAYLEKNGADYIDLTKNEWETIGLYGEGDHIAVRHRGTFTRRFVETYPELFRESP